MCEHEKNELAIAKTIVDIENFEVIYTIMFNCDSDVIIVRLKDKDIHNTTIEKQQYAIISEGFINTKIINTSKFNVEYNLIHNESSCEAI